MNESLAKINAGVYSTYYRQFIHSLMIDKKYNEKKTALGVYERGACEETNQYQ